MSVKIQRPIFFIGMGRSGTTILFEALARHPQLAWPSSYCRMYPDQLWVNGLRRLLDNQIMHLYSNKQQYGGKRLLNDYFPQPDEAYDFWNRYAGERFARYSLYQEKCDPDNVLKTRKAVSQVIRWQGRNRFSAKFTGPPRITYLKSIFPDAIFINVIRDGRAVVHSLLNVTFWKEKGGLISPFWKDYLREEDLIMWEESGKDPGILAAIEWRRAFEMTQSEIKDIPDTDYHEVRYEDYMLKPHEVLSQLCEKTNLKDSISIHEFVNQGTPLKNMNNKYKRDYSAEYIKRLEAVMQPVLDTLDY